MLRKLVIFFDGASRKNPGESGSGWYIKTSDQGYIKKGFEYVGIKTNNQAEYLALLKSLEIIKKDFENLKDIDLTIKGDSELIIKQLKGEYKVKNLKLKEYYMNVIKILDPIEKIKYVWIPRVENKIADSLANLAIDNQTRNYDYK